MTIQEAVAFASLQEQVKAMAVQVERLVRHQMALAVRLAALEAAAGECPICLQRRAGDTARQRRRRHRRAATEALGADVATG